MPEARESAVSGIFHALIAPGEVFAANIKPRDCDDTDRVSPSGDLA
jgi:hypothetical protein